jgi:hypothetical protein
MSSDADREGFRILRADHALLPMELLWRWSFGLGVLALSFFAYSHLHQFLILPELDQALSSQDSLAFADALSRSLADALPLMLPTLAFVFTVAAVLWIFASTLGRGVITRIIVRRLATEAGLTLAPDAQNWGGFAMLNSARILMLLIPVIGYLGGALIAGIVNGPAQNVLVPPLIIFLALAVSCVLWSYVNWVLSLAPIFLVRDALRPLDAIVTAISFINRNRSHLSAIAIRNGTYRGLFATGISIAGTFTAFAISSQVGSILLAVETILYLLISDIFLLARLAAYASVAVRELAFSQQFAASQDHSGKASS